MMIKKSLKTLFLLTSIAFVGCSRTNDNIPQDILVKDFVWGGMNAYYKWQENIPELADDKFITQEQLNTFLEDFKTPESLFESLRYDYGNTDKYSFMVDNYLVLEEAFKGTLTTTGLKFLEKKEVGGEVYALVTEVISGSDASIKGLKRGDIITKVDDVTLTKENIKTVFNKNSFSVTLKDGSVKTLTKTQITENPIKVSKTITTSKGKVGYLMYNQFVPNFDDQLNDVFQSFKNDNITDLIIDLRYNGEGSARTAQYLASMITGQFTDEVFCKEEWNGKVMKNIKSNFQKKFVDEINHDDIDEPIVSLGMTKVYFIISNQTASASELLISGLIPYLGDSNVVLVGQRTKGKLVGSITLYDSDDYLKDGENFNTSHFYALQPIVFELKNADGENKLNGFKPSIRVKETDFLGALGDETEPLLKRVLEEINNSPRIGLRNFTTTSKTIGYSESNNIDYQKMYVDLK